MSDCVKSDDKGSFGVHLIQDKTQQRGFYTPEVLFHTVGVLLGIGFFPSRAISADPTLQSGVDLKPPGDK